MRSFREVIKEKAGDTAVFTFGRFNPPTTGHEKLIDALAREQSKNSGSMMYVFPSQSQNPKKDPLPFSLKVAYMRKMFPKYAKNIKANKKIRMVFDIAVFLHNKGHRAIVMVVGSDRVAEFDKLLNTYNGVDGRHGYYGFDDIKVVSAGERDPDAEGVTGMSASKMRAAASEGDFDSFKTGVPAGFKDARKLFNDVRKNMGIREEKDMGDMSDLENLRDMYLTGKIWNAGDLVEANGYSGEIIRKGTNYLSFVDKDGKVHKAWLHEIVLDEKIAEKTYLRRHHKLKNLKVPVNRRKGKIIKPDLKLAKRESFKDFVGIIKMKEKLGKDADAGDYIDDFRKSDAPQFKGKSDKKIRDMAIAAYLDKKDKSEGAYGYEKQDPDIKDKKGSQPAKYFKGISKSTKSKRDSYFKSQSKKSDDDPSAYKPAPGDADAKTKPSVHTKKFKQMYGEEPRIPRKKGQPANSDKHSDLYTDENPKGTIHGLGFKDVETAKASVSKIENSGKTHAHKIQAAIAMEQRARVMGKTAEAAVYRKFIDKMKEKTKEKNESLWANIHKKRERIKRGSGERMRSPGEKGAPTPAQLKRAKGEEKDLNEWGEIEEASEYQGRKVTLNKPFYTPDGPKKSAVYVKNEKGKVVIVRFGDPNMEIKKDDPARRKSFRARHQCDTNPGPKWKARYWSCKAW